MNSNTNKKGDAVITFFTIAVMLTVVCPPIGAMLLVIGIIVVSIKKDLSKPVNGEKKTDYSGMSRAMVKNNLHEHTAGMHKTDFCGTDKQMVKNNATPNRSQIVNNMAKKHRGSYYDGKTNEQIYNELVNRKTDYSGVDPNILRRG